MRYLEDTGWELGTCAGTSRGPGENALSCGWTMPIAGNQTRMMELDVLLWIYQSYLGSTRIRASTGDSHFNDQSECDVVHYAARFRRGLQRLIRTMVLQLGDISVTTLGKRRGRPLHPTR